MMSLARFIEPERLGSLVLVAVNQPSWINFVAFLSERGGEVGSFGDVTKGEIQIVTDHERVQQCFEAELKRVSAMAAKTGVVLSDDEVTKQSQPGIVYQDRYATLARHPVFFPGQPGKPPVPGMYLSWYWGGFPGPVSGACSMPIMPDGKVVMVKMFRHATRSWCLEFPRGGIDAVGSIKKVLEQELKEEAGLQAGEMLSLGSMEPDTGILAQRVPVYLVRVVGEAGKAMPEYAEVITGLMFFTEPMLRAVLLAQEYDELQPDGTMRKYSVRGSFENFAYNQAKMRGLI